MPLRLNRTAQSLCVPVALAALSVAGLVIGLTGDGWRDALCIAALATPLAITIPFFLRPRSSGGGASARPRAMPPARKSPSAQTKRTV